MEQQDKAATPSRRGRKPGTKHVRRTIPRDSRVGWPVPDWCDAVGISRAKFYILLRQRHAQSARTALIGNQRRVIESPQAYLDRIAATQVTA